MTPKELAFKWLEDKLDPSKVNPEVHELLALSDKKVSDANLKKAQDTIHAEVAKWRTRCSDYLAKRETK